MKSFILWISFLLISLLFLSSSYLLAHGDKFEKKEKKPSAQHWTAPPEEQERINPVPLSGESVSRGKELYINDCAGCHGANADGKGPDAQYLNSRPSNLRAMAGHHTDGGMAWKIQQGRGDMPAWQGILTEIQTWELVNYIQNLKKTD